MENRFEFPDATFETVVRSSRPPRIVGESVTSVPATNAGSTSGVGTPTPAATTADTSGPAQYAGHSLLWWTIVLGAFWFLLGKVKL